MKTHPPTWSMQNIYENIKTSTQEWLEDKKWNTYNPTLLCLYVNYERINIETLQDERSNFNKW